MNKAGLKSIFLSLSLFLILPDAFAWVSIQLDPAYLPADGESTVTITATVIGPGNPSATPPIPAGPRAGDTISFAIEQGEGTIDPATTTTDINGQAFTTFTAGTKPERVIIRVTDTTVGQFAHGFVTAFKVEIKASDGQLAPPKFIALNGTSSYYAKTLPIPLAGDFKWSIIKKKNAEIQGSIASQLVTLKGIKTSKKVDDTGLKVMFKPTYATDYAVDMLDVTVVGVTFNPTSIDVGTDGIGVTVRSGETKAVTATVKPNDLTIDFSVDDTNKATVSPSTGSGVVNLTITSVGDADASLRASKNLQLLGNASVRLHKPKRMEFVNVYDVPLPPGQYGDIEQRFYNVYDFQNRAVDIYNYFIQEFITMVENDDGTGHPYENVPTPFAGANPNNELVDTLRFIWETGTLEPGHKYKWNQKFQILGLDVENNLWKHDFRRVDATHLEIDSYAGQW